MKADVLTRWLLLAGFFLLAPNRASGAVVISAISNQVISEDTSTAAIPFGITGFQSRTPSVVGSSDNARLIPDTGIVIQGTGGSRTVTVTPAANQSGSATITLEVADPAGKDTETFVVTVRPVNDPPTITDFSNPTIDEDQVLGPLAFTIDDVDTPITQLTIATSTSNQSLVPPSAIAVGGSGANRTLTVTPAANLSGTVVIGVSVSDGILSDITRFTLTVRAVNDPPVFSKFADVAIDEDTNTGDIVFNLTDVDSPTGSLTITGRSSNKGLVPDQNVVVGTVVGTTLVRIVRVTPLPDQFGDAVITLTGSDGNASTEASFNLRVNPVNDGPTISRIPDQKIDEDTNTGPIAFQVDDIDTPLDQLVLSAVSTEPAVVPISNVVFGGSGNNRTVTVTPLPNQSGNATITVSVSDGALGTGTRFTVSVAAVNDSPTISDVANQTINENSNTGALAFTVGDVETAAANLTVQASSSNTTLVPNANVVLGGSGASRTVTVTPAANQSGTTTVTVTVSDGTTTASDTFTVTVRAANRPPTISDIADQAINEDTSTGPLAFTVGDAETAVANLTVQASSSNTTLVPNANVVLGGSGASRTVTVTPAANQSGTTVVTVTVSDGTATASDTFTVTVRAVNDPPTISEIPDQNVQGGTGTGLIRFVVADPDGSPGNLALTASSSDLVLVPLNAMVLGGSEGDRTLEVTPVGIEGGSARITITVTDGIATASASFVLTVSSGVVAPKIATAPQDVSVNEGETVTLRVTATGTAPFRYQWLLNGQEVPSATDSTLVIRNVQAGQAGAYSVRVSNSAGTVTSTPAAVAVFRLDFGDAPEGSLALLYRTRLASNGPRHRIVEGFVLGKTADGETDGQPNADATGDDLSPTNLDDEDGVQFASAFEPGKPATLVVTASSQGVLDAWFDFNRANAFEPGERYVAGFGLVPGPNTVVVNVPADARPGETFARFRLTRGGIQTPDHLGSTAPVPEGEVEDYKISVREQTLALDFGDAPDSVAGTAAFGYPTLLAKNGARHVIVEGLYLGKTVDAETDGQPNATATGDDINPQTLDDEDGVEFQSPLVAGESVKISVTASQTGHLDAWMDFNGNQSWADQGEQIFVSTVLVGGVNNLTFQVPASARAGVTYARFRFSRDGKLGFVGQARDGEVEDYQARIQPGSPCDTNYKGREFWLTFPGNYPESPSTPLRLTLCIVGPEGITGTVEIPGLRFSRAFTLPASMKVDILLPDAASLGDDVDVVRNKGIHVEASAPVAVYGLNRIPYSSDGYLGLPVEVLGREHLIAGYPNVFSGVSALNGTQFAIVATEDDTSVTIIPSRTVLGHLRNQPFVVPLKRGQTYQLRDPNDATADLTGTEVISDKPIAVFSGHQCANIESPSQMFCDHLVEQLLPVTAWGKIFHAVPLATRVNGDILRILGSKNDTKLFINGVDVGTLDRGQVRRFTLSAVTRIDATRPVFVSQLARSSDFDGVEKADPFLVTVPPVRFYTRDHMICTGPDALSTHHVNIVAPSAVAGVLTLDGVAVPAGLFTPIGASGFSSARLTVSEGPHALSAPQPFGSIVYGFGPYEGYGWPGGMFFGDITPPTMTCPEDFAATTGSVNATTGAFACVAVVPDLRPKVVIEDNCGLPSERAVTQTPAPGTQVGPGEYVITLVAHDASGNEAECEVTMTVVDPGPAAIVCPKDFTVICNKGAGASVAFQVVARTPCGSLVPVECTPESGALFPLGVTTVVCRIKDSPNQTCTFKVNVVCPPIEKGGILVRNPPTLSWTGDEVLETSLSPDGPWTSVPEARSPFSPALLEGGQFFRLRAEPRAVRLLSESPQAPRLVWE
ncbi:MAG: tandem-95 repeat protein [Limisphaerales bacterium]